MTTDREQILALGREFGIEFYDYGSVGNPTQFEAFYHASRKPLLDSLEAMEREIAELREIVQARGIGIDEISRERDSLAEQVKVLTDLSTELLKLAQKLDPIGAARFYVELATGGK